MRGKETERKTTSGSHFPAFLLIPFPSISPGIPGFLFIYPFCVFLFLEAGRQQAGNGIDSKQRNKREKDGERSRSSFSSQLPFSCCSVTQPERKEIECKKRQYILINRL